MDTLKAKCIELCDEDGKAQVVLSAGKNVSGLWIENQAGDLLAIWSEKEAVAIGFYAPGNRNTLDFCLSINRQGEVYMQKRRPDGEPEITQLVPSATPKLPETHSEPFEPASHF